MCATTKVARCGALAQLPLLWPWCNPNSPEQCDCIFCYFYLTIKEFIAGAEENKLLTTTSTSISDLMCCSVVLRVASCERRFGWPSRLTRALMDYNRLFLVARPTEWRWKHFTRASEETTHFDCARVRFHLVCFRVNCRFNIAFTQRMTVLRSDWTNGTFPDARENLSRWQFVPGRDAKNKLNEWMVCAQHCNHCAEANERILESFSKLILYTISEVPIIFITILLLNLPAQPIRDVAAHNRG